MYVRFRMWLRTITTNHASSSSPLPHYFSFWSLNFLGWKDQKIFPSLASFLSKLTSIIQTSHKKWTVTSQNFYQPQFPFTWKLFQPLLVVSNIVGCLHPSHSSPSRFKIFRYKLFQSFSLLSCITSWGSSELNKPWCVCSCYHPPSTFPGGNWKFWYLF